MQRGRFFFSFCALILCPDWSTLLPGFLPKRENNQEASALRVSSSNKWLQNSPAKSVNKNYFSLKWVSPLRFHVYLKELCTAPWDADVMWQNIRLCIKQGRGEGGGDIGTRVWELWDLETRDEGLGDIKYGTWGRVGRGRGTSNTGTRGRQIQGRRDVNDYCKSRREMRYQSLSSWICLSEHNPPCPPYEARTRRRPPALKKVKLLSWYSCWWNIGALNRVGWVTVTKVYIE